SPDRERTELPRPHPDSVTGVRRQQVQLTKKTRAARVWFTLTLPARRDILPRPNQRRSPGLPTGAAVNVLAEPGLLAFRPWRNARLAAIDRDCRGERSGRSRRNGRTSGMRLASALARHDATPDDTQADRLSQP